MRPSWMNDSVSKMPRLFRPSLRSVVEKRFISSRSPAVPDSGRAAPDEVSTPRSSVTRYSWKVVFFFFRAFSTSARMTVREKSWRSFPMLTLETQPMETR